MSENPTRTRSGVGLDPDGRTRMADRPREWKPPADVLDAPEQFTIRINLPGLTRERISIVLPDERTVVIRGIYGVESQAETATYLLAERPQVPVEKILRLPSPVCVDDVVATLEHGVLTLRLPKRERSAGGPRQIPIA